MLFRRQAPVGDSATRQIEGEAGGEAAAIALIEREPLMLT
jgi:hypothetical protein